MASTQHRMVKKASASGLRSNLLYDAADDVDTEELDPIEYSFREDVSVTHTKVRITLSNVILPNVLV